MSSYQYDRQNLNLTWIEIGNTVEVYTATATVAAPTLGLLFSLFLCNTNRTRYNQFTFQHTVALLPESCKQMRFNIEVVSDTVCPVGYLESFDLRNYLI